MRVENLTVKEPFNLIRTKGTYLFCVFFLCSSIALAQEFEKGVASYYSDKLHGKMTASGETYDTIKMTAAHPSLAFNTMVKVTVLSSGKNVVVRINDRGPYVPGRILDISKAAAKKLKILDKGLAEVSLELLKKP